MLFEFVILKRRTPADCLKEKIYIHIANIYKLFQITICNDFYNDSR